ncbi:MAG: hypothetical protein PHE04_00300 [Bacteroidales bacterium]|nr:hypothetical protein [Bacteroidales bacterium]MDD3430890.1 hypothetical protein [Bacteroidales bacterium]MDD4361292.1 hypothetical protein [Bacteroidales bacterium]MDD4429925.1 hypothetical protein [Bacteroidales bacterium]
MKNTKGSGLMLYLVVVPGFVVKAQESANIFVGSEYYELAQNRFRNLGPDYLGRFGLQRMVFPEQAVI